MTANAPEPVAADRTPTEPAAPARPGVSFVVIGRNEARHLDRCFRSIAEGGYPRDRLEIIYVDSDSTDESVAIAKRWADRIVVAKLPGPHPGLARNLGWEIARHDLVHFVDGDTALEPSWLGRAVDVITENPDVFCVFGNLIERRPDANVFHRVYDFDWTAPADHITETRTSGGNVLVRRAGLVAHGGFDPSLEAGEEPDLCTRARLRGERLLQIDTPMARHDMDMRGIVAYWRRAVRSGHAYALIASRYGRTAIPMWRAEVRRNLALAIGALAAGIAVAVASSPWIALAAGTAMMGALVARKALQHRSAKASTATIVAYALHVYLVKIPIIYGHLRFYVRRWFGIKHAAEAHVLDQWKRDQ